MCQVASPFETKLLYEKSVLDYDVRRQCRTPLILPTSFRNDETIEPYSKQLRVHQSCKKPVSTEGAPYCVSNRPRSRSTSIFKFLFQSYVTSYCFCLIIIKFIFNYFTPT